MELFTQFFQQFTDLIQGLEFGSVIKAFFTVLPDAVINSLGMIFCLSALGFVIKFLKGWF